MQNELNELRNQVRTLKRMLFGIFGLVVVGGLLAATEVEWRSVEDWEYESISNSGDRSLIIPGAVLFRKEVESGKYAVTWSGVSPELVGAMIEVERQRSELSWGPLSNRQIMLNDGDDGLVLLQQIAQASIRSCGRQGWMVFQVDKKSGGGRVYHMRRKVVLKDGVGRRK